MKLIKYNIFILLFYANSVLAKFAQEEVSKKEKNNSFLNMDTGIEIVTFLFVLVFIASIIGFLFSGIYFLAAGGDEGTLESAHKTWQASLTGLIVSLVGYISIKLFNMLLF